MCLLVFRNLYKSSILPQLAAMSQFFLTTVMTNVVVDKSVDQAKPLSNC